MLQEILSQPGEGKPAKLGPHVVYTLSEGDALLEKRTHINSMKVVYDNGKDTVNSEITDLYNETFDQVKTRLNEEWARNAPSPAAISGTLLDLQTATKDDNIRRLENMRSGQMTTPPDHLGSAATFSQQIPRPFTNQGDSFIASDFTTTGEKIVRLLDKALNI